MASRSLQVMAASVQRQLRDADIGPIEIFDALNKTNLELSASYEWPWLVRKYDLVTAGPYRTGTISVANGSSIVNGVGTTWDPSWTDKRLLLGDNADWEIDTVVNPTQLTLSQVYRGTSLVNTAYTIYQDTYPMPADYEPGQISSFTIPQFRVQIFQVDRPSFEKEAVVQKLVYTTFAQKFCDRGYRDGYYLIGLLPPPSQAYTCDIVYKARSVMLSALTDYPELPEAWGDILELGALADLKRQHGTPGWDVDAQIASRKQVKMRHSIASSMEIHAADSANEAERKLSSFTVSIKPWGAP